MRRQPVWGGSVDLLLCPRARCSPLSHTVAARARSPIWTRSKQRSPPLRTITGRNRPASPFRWSAEPPPLPAWLSKADAGFYTNEFPRTGFRGGLNWYHHIGRNRELLAPFDGLLVSVPAPYIAGDRDPVIEFPGMDGHISPTWRSSCHSFAVRSCCRLQAYHPGRAGGRGQCGGDRLHPRFASNLTSSRNRTTLLPPPCWRLLVMSALGHGR